MAGQPTKLADLRRMMLMPILTRDIATVCTNVQRNPQRVGPFCLNLVFCFALSLVALTGSPAPATAKTCGDGGRCDVEGGYYLAALPDDWDGKSKLPLVVFFHGWNASPEAMFRNEAMVTGVTGRGAIFVAPFAERGYWRQLGQNRAEPGRDELRYVKTVLADLRRRWPIDDNQILATGFSRGASLVVNLACYAGDLFTGYAPIAGGFWNDSPKSCPGGPVLLRHIHGRKDGVAPYDKIGPYVSIPITRSIALLRDSAGCSGEARSITSQTKKFTCTGWTSCHQPGRIELCLHPGGHSIPAQWVGEAFDWMRTTVRK